MSRIGKMPITVPQGVKVTIKGNEVQIEGPKGKLVQKLRPEMLIKFEEGVIKVERPSDEPQMKAFHGLTRSLINNMVVGVSEGYEKILEIEGVGYRPALDGKVLILNVGFSHEVRVKPADGITFDVDTKTRTIRVFGIDKQLVGHTAADIRKIKPPEPYKGKGIRYQGEYVKRKAGKAGKVVA
ncbi:MAG: 50S ribosomal protein L6 [Chloroflexi bacterium]|nr:50S ribosomal protein L6 [Chloroflexota bacterium]